MAETPSLIECLVSKFTQLFIDQSPHCLQVLYLHSHLRGDDIRPCSLEQSHLVPYGVEWEVFNCIVGNLFNLEGEDSCHFEERSHLKEGLHAQSQLQVCQDLSVEFMGQSPVKHGAHQAGQSDFYHGQKQRVEVYLGALSVIPKCQLGNATLEVNNLGCAIEAVAERLMHKLEVEKGDLKELGGHEDTHDS